VEAKCGQCCFKAWTEIAQQMPKCPAAGDVRGFLKAGPRLSIGMNTRVAKPLISAFGLSRATTLLYFLSGGAYPIFDSRVRTALARLLRSRVDYDLQAYQQIVGLRVRDFAILLSLQERTTGEQTIDRALFSYGMVRLKQAK
jgi:hypothetical protein